MKSNSKPSLQGGSTRFPEPIAIVGMGGVFPSAGSLADFWELVANGVDTSRPVPAGRWALDPTTIRNATAGTPDSVLTDRGCFIDEPFEGELDPMYQLLRRAGQAALADARMAGVARERTGLIIGNIALPTAGASALGDEILAPLYEQQVFGTTATPAELQTQALNRYVTGLPAGMLARELGLGAACFTLDAACASSLYAVKLACDELLARRADAMLAGGLSRPDSLYTQMGFSQLRALSPSGRCAPFDHKGDGLIVGEGAGLVVLKRLDDALRDGDRILALIRGCGLSNDLDGKLLSPSSEGQLRALHMAYAQAGWTPHMVDLIECHATGTPVGDAVEFASLAKLWEGGRWQQGQCVLSAVKSNIGHLLTAAGSAGLIKTLLAMQHGQLPPVANFERASDKVSLAASPFAVLQEAAPWERRAPDVPRRAAINGFGFGGINAHLLIEEWMGEAPVAKATTAPAPREPIAVVGMATSVGRWTDLDAFRERVLRRSPDVSPTVRASWRGLESDAIEATWGKAFPGHYLEDLAVPIDRFHIAPLELAQMLPQQLLMLDVAKSALEDAGNPALEAPRSGVFIGLGLDLRTTDFHFRWAMKARAPAWAARAGLDPHSAEANSWMQGLCDGANPPLTADRTLGALGGIVASRIAREFKIGGPSFGISSEETSGLHALEVAARALQAGELDIALAGAVDLNGDLRALIATDAARTSAAVPGEGAACVVLKRLADAERDGDRIYAVIRDFAATPEPAEAVASAEIDVGHAGAASGLLSFVKASLCLHEQVLPGERKGSAPRHWVRNRAAGPRAAHITASGVMGATRHVLLQGVENQHTPPSLATPAIALSATVAPRASAGRIAFVYPGTGNQFGDMGRELALQWPDVIRQQDAEIAHLADQVRADLFWQGPLSPEVLRDHRALICGQVSFGTLVSDLAMHFGLKPDAAIGYSLGESTALLALRAWRGRDEMLQRLRESSLFATDLAGGPGWVTGMVDRAADTVRAAFGRRRDVYVLIVNTPEECVIGGERDSIAAVVAELGCNWYPLQGVSTVHCELARPVRRAYRELHHFKTTPPAGVDFYSCASGRAYVPDSESAADALEAQALDTIDFPRVIRAAHGAGVRTFVEMGPGNSCTRMIGRILQGKPHVAKSLAVAGPDPVGYFLRALAELHAAGVPLDVEKLRPSAAPAAKPPMAGKRVTVSISGAALKPPPLPARRPPAALDPKPAPAPQMDDFSIALYRSMVETERATVEAHEAYLRFSSNLALTMAQAITTQASLASQAPAQSTAVAELRAAPRALDRNGCLEFARGLVGRALGPEFAAADSYPTRVRLPDEPLMLVDRITEIDAEPLSMTHGRVVTEHDIHPGAWYLDCDRIPTCIAVEAGQADLFLSGYLGIDFQTRGHSMYRLLDAKISFHRGLPGPGEVIRYDIRIDHFFRQADTWLFRFSFEATVGGAPLLTMTDGCAGFFSQAELASGKGIVRTALDMKPIGGKRPADWEDFTPQGVESYSGAQLEQLRRGDLGACFGPAFAQLPVARPITLPDGRMNLVHRITRLDPRGGRFGIGQVVGEADIHPDDWFLTCHFVDDRVMPGTLMFECCMHTLRVFLLRMGWISEQGSAVLEPVPGIASRLKCRGQVLDTTKLVTYEISLKEIGYGPEPYVIADALMYADGKAIVEITDMSLRYAGASRDDFRALWSGATQPRRKPAIYDDASILAFAIGKPSEAFGEPYRIFDHDRVIARLPGPPYKFLDRITAVEGEPWKINPGTHCEAQYEVPPDAWYFGDNGQHDMPFAVLLEIALQPCGWLAAYMGSALQSDVDVSFRNLGGTATQLARVLPDVGTLTIRAKLTRASSSAGMIIQFFDYEVLAGSKPVYRGDTYFGFFPKAALAKQEGIKDAVLYQPQPAELARARSLAFPHGAAHPSGKLQLLDRIACWVPDGGPHGLGFIRATRKVIPDEWFFKAHFHQDPVVPGSLGLEAFLQLLKFVALERWGRVPGSVLEAVASDARHEWIYRGQVIPTDSEVSVEAVVTHVDDSERVLRAEGYLSVDGRNIYRMREFTLRQVQL